MTSNAEWICRIGTSLEGLQGDDTIRVPLTEVIAQKNEEIFKGSDGKFAKFRALKSSQKDKSKEMKAILTSDQYKKYEEMMKETVEDFKRKRA